MAEVSEWLISDRLLELLSANGVVSSYDHDVTQFWYTYVSFSHVSSTFVYFRHDDETILFAEWWNIKAQRSP